MSDTLDDLEAVRTIVNALEKFEVADQERIIRWAREKLGLPIYDQSASLQDRGEERKDSDRSSVQDRSTNVIDIKTFVGEKNPQGDNHFAATVAYYYRFVAPEPQRKDSITADDLQDACRQVEGRKRFKYPDQTLRNTVNAGLLDKAGRGSFRINTVGENLVAMTLPSHRTSSGSVRNLKTNKNKQSKKSKTKASGRKKKFYSK